MQIQKVMPTPEPFVQKWETTFNTTGSVHKTTTESGKTVIIDLFKIDSTVNPYKVVIDGQNIEREYFSMSKIKKLVKEAKAEARRLIAERSRQAETAKQKRDKEINNLIESL